MKNIILKWLPSGNWAYPNNQKADNYSKSYFLQWQKCSTFQLLLPAFGEVNWATLPDSVTVLVEKAKSVFQKLRFLLLQVVVAVLARPLCLPIYNTRYHKPVLILKLCAIPHTNCATTIMHGNRCSLLWAMFFMWCLLWWLCLSPVFSVEHLQQSWKTTEKRKQNGFSLASFQPYGKAWPVSLSGGFFPIMFCSERVCHKQSKLCQGL